MVNEAKDILKQRLSAQHYERLIAIENSKLLRFVADAVELTNPASVYVCTDSPEDIEHVRELAVKTGEEIPLNIKGHTCHFDGYNDQGRDTFSTRYLLPAGSTLGESLKSVEKQAGTKEVRDLLKNSMAGREMLVSFWTLGPVGSEFAIPCVQITDSPYVAHSESLLYRPGYEQFRKIAASPDFFRFLHSEGELENGVSKKYQSRRVYIDLEEEMVYSVNTQYGGNTMGLKKLALRLAIQKASREGWLAEHMFVMGVHGPNDRVTYFTGAFPSACGKTATSMLRGQTIVGDDIAYLRKKNARMCCVNVEKGIFGIIQDVNSKDDPVIYKALTSPMEVIFSNVLIADRKPFWLGMGCDLPAEGVNFSGKWFKGKKGPEGNEISPAHKNARYCLSIPDLDNCDPALDDPQGVSVGGIVYGGRDSDTWVPVEQAFNWAEGIILKGACLESETTAATLGKQGVRTFNVMSNIDFVSIPIGRYVQNNLDFAKGVEKPPLIFSVNYFLRDKNNKYLNGMADKLIWILWAELRVHNEVNAITTPTGFIPFYDDLARLFNQHLQKDYTKDDYVRQFTVRVPENLEKLDRVEKVFTYQVPDTPEIIFITFDIARTRLKDAAQKLGEYISPFDLPGKQF
ncbi:MAG: phosphoenolpyruvate carboxykinase (GTP) [Sedimentisphaerales bacterium]|nr:phosphoenolpyruvate carboxykinase (GTP) [Sedimentisphaerales bacterium]